MTREQAEQFAVDWLGDQPPDMPAADWAPRLRAAVEAHTGGEFTTRAEWWDDEFNVTVIPNLPQPDLLLMRGMPPAEFKQAAEQLAGRALADRELHIWRLWVKEATFGAQYAVSAATFLARVEQSAPAEALAHWQTQYPALCQYFKEAREGLEDK